MPAQRILPILFSLALPIAVPWAPARAADVTPMQATDLQEQLRAWMASLVSPAVDVGPKPVLVSADGDHFNVELPAPVALSQAGVVPPGLSIKMTAKPLDGGRYALENLVLPSPLKLTAPKELVDAAKSQDPNAAAQMPDLSKGMEISYKTVDFHGILDPNYATTSSFDTTYTGLRIVGPNSESTTDRSVSHSTWQPSGDGNINVVAEGRSEGMKAVMHIEKGGTVEYSFKSTSSSANAKSVSPANLATLIRSIAALAPTLAGTKDSLSPEQRTLARNAVFALRDMQSGFETGGTMNGISFSAEGHKATLDKVSIATRAGLDDGKMQFATDVALEGFNSPEVPAGVYRDYLPRKLVLKPRISGVPRDDLFKLILRAIDSSAADMPDLQEQAIALLGAGPLEIAIDEIALDLGRASLSGNGSLDIASPTDITGDAEITVAGLDALIKTANTKPELKQAAPVLIFLKGIGKQDGDKTVWAIKYEDNKVTVNDTDLSDLIPKK